jgi:hypothetical protein
VQERVKKCRNQYFITYSGSMSKCLILLLFSGPRAHQFLLSFFNRCFSEGSIPYSWRFSHEFLLFKGKGSVIDPDSYRSISLLASFFKLFEVILFNRLRTWSESRGLVSPLQFGFREKKSTLDLVFVLLTVIRKYVFFVGVPLILVFVDLMKAFPSVPRRELFVKLSLLGVSKKFLGILLAIHLNTECSYRFGGFLSRPVAFNRGLREGGVLSPLLFLLYFNDVVSVFTNLPFSRPSLGGDQFACGLFANDLVFVSFSVPQAQIILDRLL